MLSAIAGIEHATPLAIIHYPNVNGVRLLHVSDDRRYVTMRVSMVRGSPGAGTVIGYHNPAAIRRQQYALRISRIDVNVVYHDFGIADALPGLAQIHRLPKTFGGSRINDVRVRGVLVKHPCASR